MAMDDLLKQAKEMRVKQQRELSETFAEASAAQGAVAAKMDGHKHLRAIKIDPVLMAGDDLSELEQHVIAAVNEATAKMDAILVRKFGPSSGIPDLF